MNGIPTLGLTLGLVLLAGCSTASKTASTANAGAKEKLVPDSTLTGHVVKFNPTAKWAVLQFPPGRMAANGQWLFVYRDSQRVGELKVSGPSRDDRTAADLMQGECKAGDEVRER